MSNVYALTPWITQQFFDTNGEPLAGGMIYSYEAGTTTPQATYTDATGDTPNTNPVILDSTGSAQIWMAPSSYKFVIADANNNVIRTVDDVVQPGSDVSIDLETQVNGILPVGNGGIGVENPTAHGVLVGEGTSAVNSVTGAAGEVLQGSSGDPSFTATPSLGANGGTGGSLTLNGSTSGSVTIGVPANPTTYSMSLPGAAGTNGQPLVAGALGTTAFETLGIGGGGTGQTTATAAANALLPSQTNNAGLVLGTNGTNTGWISPPAGTKNYLSIYTASTSGGTANSGNGNFELGGTTGWALGTIGTLTNGLPTGTPTFGSGASVDLSITTVSGGSQIGGSYSGSYASSAATTQGNMLHTNAFYIDAESQAQVLAVSFNYKIASGASNGNFSNTSSNSFAWAIYDVTNSVWIPVSNPFRMIQSSGVGQLTGSFQTASNTAELRFCLYNMNATSGAITLTLDDFVIGPSSASQASVVAMKAHTTTASNMGTLGTSATVVKYDTIDNDTCAGYSTSTGIYTIPVSGFYNIAASIYTSGTFALNGYVTLQIYNVTTSSALAFNQFTAGGAISTSTTTPVSANSIYLNAGTEIEIIASYGGTYTSGAYATSTTGNFFTITQVQPSGVGPAGQVVDFAGTQTSQSVTANTTNIAFTTTKDSTASWNGTQFVCPVSGDYVVVGNAIVSSTASIQVYHGSNGLGFFSTGNDTASAGAALVTGCNAGDTISVRATASVTVTDGSLAIYMLLGPQSNQAPPSVNAGYTDTSGATIGTSAGVFAYQTKLFDTHNAYSTSTGLYTVPESGRYRISAILCTATVTLTTAEQFFLRVYHNGTQYCATAVNGTGGSGLVCINDISTTVDCLAGDTLGIYASSGVSTTSNSSANLNNLSIECVG